jgi:hypothetical protein
LNNKSITQAPVLYVAEGDAPGTRVPVRIITDNGDVAATALNGILERMPRPKDAVVLPVTCFITPSGADFEGFIVEQGDGKIVFFFFFKSCAHVGFFLWFKDSAFL